MNETKPFTILSETSNQNRQLSPGTVTSQKHLNCKEHFWGRKQERQSSVYISNILKRLDINVW